MLRLHRENNPFEIFNYLPFLNVCLLYTVLAYFPRMAGTEEAVINY